MVHPPLGVREDHHPRRVTEAHAKVVKLLVFLVVGGVQKPLADCFVSFELGVQPSADEYLHGLLLAEEGRCELAD